jgi:hypothetical protein
MIQYEQLPVLEEKPSTLQLRTQHLPELVHLEDPAFAVMSDFRLARPPFIHANVNMDDALNEMKVTGSHLLLVVSDDNSELLGLLASEDLLGEKPIQHMNESRLAREQVLVKALMTPANTGLMFEFDDIQSARVGNVVTTMQAHHSHYALVIQADKKSGQPLLRGLFNSSQISKQLHTAVAGSIAKAQSITELKDRL